MSTADLGKLMKQAQQMQENIQRAQNELASMTVEGVAGAGLVKIQMTGRYEVLKVAIDSGVWDDDKDIAEDLIAAAVNDAVRKVETGSKTKMAGLMSGLDLPEGFQMPPQS